MSVLTEVFYISISTLFCGGVGLLIKSIYKIKCSEVRCCGCIDIKRNIEEELKIDLEKGSPVETRRSSLTFGLNKI